MSPTLAATVAEPGSSDDEDEEQSERYRELLEELRTIIPGVQVLFGFLLTVPFSARFTQLDDFGTGVFSAALFGVAVTTVVFLTPAALHRVRPTLGGRERLRLAVGFTIAGMGLLATSVATAVFVVARFIFDHTNVGAAFGSLLLALAVLLWFALPLALRHRAR